MEMPARRGGRKKRKSKSESESLLSTSLNRPICRNGKRKVAVKGEGGLFKKEKELTEGRGKGVEIMVMPRGEEN